MDSQLSDGDKTRKILKMEVSLLSWLSTVIAGRSSCPTHASKDTHVMSNVEKLGSRTLNEYEVDKKKNICKLLTILEIAWLIILDKFWHNFFQDIITGRVQGENPNNRFVNKNQIIQNNVTII